MAALGRTIILIDITTYLFIRFVCKSETWSSVTYSHLRIPLAGMKHVMTALIH
jgi:hypothetical protein